MLSSSVYSQQGSVTNRSFALGLPIGTGRPFVRTSTPRNQSLSTDGTTRCG
ncbi:MULTISPECIES: hypothetical protein [Rahnella]|uniref:Rho operon leader peptide n=2 Tax=Rahnella TaxID=34037 RepID=A0ABS6LIS8_9GAMM|nr:MULTISPECIES: hypothetical protein [Rahnella]MBF7957344.1 hypothetical protein [Rahnella victoriana]MBU9846705.1 hypothetical protein [Rahnella ecdela]